MSLEVGLNYPKEPFVDYEKSIGFHLAEVQPKKHRTKRISNISKTIDHADALAEANKRWKERVSSVRKQLAVKKALWQSGIICCASTISIATISGFYTLVSYYKDPGLFGVSAILACMCLGGTAALSERLWSVPCNSAFCRDLTDPEFVVDKKIEVEGYTKPTCYTPAKIRNLAYVGVTTLAVRDKWLDLLDRYKTAVAKNDRNCYSEEIEKRVSEIGKEWICFRDQELIPAWPNPLTPDP